MRSRVLQNAAMSASLLFVGKLRCSSILCMVGRCTRVPLNVCNGKCNSGAHVLGVHIQETNRVRIISNRTVYMAENRNMGNLICQIPWIVVMMFIAIPRPNVLPGF